MHPPLNLTAMRIVPRDQGGGKLSTPSIIGISIACGCLAILALTLFLWRCLVRTCRPKKSNPLPPVQDLAHHREQQLAAFAERNPSRPATWVDDSFHGRTRYLHPTASDISLIPGTPERKSSFYMDEVATAESASTLPSPLSNDGNHLPLPNPAFLGSATGLSSAHTSMTSMSSIAADDAAPGPSMSPSLSVPYPETLSSVSHITAVSSTHPLISQTSQSSHHPPRSGPNGRSGSRPTSMVSLTGTSYSAHTSRSASNAIRGTPHGPYSNVQIVLPAPLAPQLYPYMLPLAEGSTSSLGTMADTSRNSVFVDQWVRLGAPPVSDGRTRSDRRSSWNTTPRHMSKQRPPSSFTSSSSHSTPRRSRSQPRMSADQSFPSIPSIRSSSSTSMGFSPEHPPPIPRVPSAYGKQALLPQQGPGDENGRGRSRTSRSGSLPANAQVLHDQEPKQLQKHSPRGTSKGRILQKQRSRPVS